MIQLFQKPLLLSQSPPSFFCIFLCLHSLKMPLFSFPHLITCMLLFLLPVFCFLLHKYSTSFIRSSHFPSSLLRSLVNCYFLLFCSQHLLSWQCFHFTFLVSVVDTSYVHKLEDSDLKAFNTSVCKIIFSESWLPYSLWSFVVRWSITWKDN